MPTPTYKALATVTLSSSAATVTFTSIPATYRDLVLVLNLKALTGGTFPRARINGDTGSNYPRVIMNGPGTGVAANSSTSTNNFLTITGDASMSADFNFHSISHFMDYSTTNKHKTVLGRSNNSAVSVSAIVTKWSNNADITSIQLLTSSSSFAVGSTFNLYGIAG